MKNIQTFGDKTAIGLSLLCTLHCLVFPLILVLSPSLAALGLNDEALHLWMVLAVIPISTYALTLGCKQHRKHGLLAIGLTGLALLIGAVLLGESFLGETWEKILTVIGSGIIAYGHFRNYRLCQHRDNCECSKLGEGLAK